MLLFLIIISFLLSKFKNKEIKISKNKYDFKNFIYIFIIIFLTISFS